MIEKPKNQPTHSNESHLTLSQRLDYVGQNANAVLSSIDSLVAHVDSIDYNNKSYNIKIDTFKPSQQQYSKKNITKTESTTQTKFKILPTRVISYGVFKGHNDTRRFQCLDQKCNVNFNEFRNCKYCKYLPYVPSPLKNNILNQDILDKENNQTIVDKNVSNEVNNQKPLRGNGGGIFINPRRSQSAQSTNNTNINNRHIPAKATKLIEEEALTKVPTYKYSRSRKDETTPLLPQISELPSQQQPPIKEKLAIPTKKKNFYNSKFYENLTEHFKKNSSISTYGDTKQKSNESKNVGGAASSYKRKSKKLLLSTKHGEAN
ncbi:hypothetical protein KGF54_005148 [Candida jiufengensis]|uniref:uncharacterized protein n=1 Tax=Candida jiufengensis TaxID=497108 RepID=UPI002223F339|nr:uncharacterized protein KGF54_005148 [Candida jiufengensis]KAI5950331.1 hypothetical protein KGF54_005148 [Candida jiufengensis]